MDTQNLLHALRDQGFKLWTDGEHLMVAPKEHITDELRALIRAHKPQLLAALAEKGKPGRLSGELETLIDRVAAFNGFSEADLAEAKEIAAGDLANAIICFRELASEYGIPAEARR